MKTTTRLLFSLITAVITSVTLTACSDSSSGDVVGLQMPTALSVVAAQPDSASPAAVMAGVVASPLPGGSTDYGSDPTQTWVYDASIEPLSMVNEILCYVGQIRAEDMVNQGAYYALVNENECKQSGGSSSDASAGASGGVSSSNSSQATKYAKWLVESTRANNISPQLVRIWVPPSGDSTNPMDNQIILVHVTVTEGVSSTNPFGKFTLNFKGVLPAGTVIPGGPTLTSDMTVMNGTLKTVDRTDNKAQFTFINQGGASVVSSLPFDMVQKSNVIMDDAAGSSGIAQTYQYDLWDVGQPAKTSKYFVSFDSTGFLRGTDIDDNNIVDPGSQVCSDRTQFDTHVWRYNLYNPTTGARVSRNSNMPFITAGGVFGNIGYWGVWLEDQSVTIADGDTITRQTWGNAAPTETYTVRVSGGRLIKRTRDTATLSSLANAQFQWHGDLTDPFCQAGTPCPTQNDYIVTVNATTGNAVVQSKVTWSTNGPPTYDTAPAGTIINVQAQTVGTQLWLWSNSLGGNAILASTGTSGVTVPTTLTFFKQDNISPTSATALSLVCYDRCIKGGITNPTTEAELFYPNDGTAYGYTLTVSGGKYTLADDTNAGAAVTIASGTDMSSITDGGGNPVDWYQWGVQSSEMVTAAVAATLTNPWEIYDQPISYRWETGPNNWNRQYSVRNTSTSVYSTFDPPLQFAYSYGAGDDPNIGAAVTSHPAGNFHLLEYGGPGELWGFPWTQDATTGHGYHTLTLKNGVILTDAASNQYIVKQLEREQTMQEDTNPTTVCDTAGLTLSTAVSSSELVLPAAVDGTVPFSISDSDALNPDPAPAVIEGELQ